MKTAYIFVLLCLALLVLLPGASGVDAYQFTPDACQWIAFSGGNLPTTSYSGADDTYVSQHYPAVKYGAAISLNVDGDDPKNSGHDNYAYLKWEMSPSIPAGAAVQEAYFEVTVTNHSGGQQYEIYEVLGAWDEATLDWSPQPGHGGTVLAVAAPSTPMSEMRVDLNGAGLAVVQKWVNTPALNHGFVIMDSLNDDGFDFESQDISVYPGDRPAFWVRYCTGGASANIIKGPYVQNPTTTGVAILWEADGNAACQLRHRQHTTPPPAWTTLTGIAPRQVLGKYLYEKPLTGVKSYEDYQVSCNGGATWLPDPPATFRKALATTSTATFTIAAYGDSRWDARLAGYEHEAVVKALVKDKPRIVLHVGDIVQFGQYYANQKGWWDEYFKPAQSLLPNVAVLPAIGNHEYKTDIAPVERIWYYDFFVLPANGVAGQAEKWYAFSYGCARFISLNTYDGETTDFSFSQAQQDWLNAEMNSPAYLNAKWQVVYLHTPLHQWPNDAPRLLRSTMQTLFKNKGVDLVLEGHVHRYERGVQDGVPYVITGGGGAPLNGCATNPMPGRITCASAYQYTALKFVCASPSSLTFKALDRNRVVLDSFTKTQTVLGMEPVMIENSELVGLEAPEEQEVEADEDLIELEPAVEAGEGIPADLAPDDLPFRLWLPVVSH
jgi:hypothetical protein